MDFNSTNPCPNPSLVEAGAVAGVVGMALELGFLVLMLVRRLVFPREQPFYLVEDL